MPKKSRPWARKAFLLMALAGPCGTLAACGNAEPIRTPAKTVAAFARAISDGRLEEAYGLMDADYRSRVPFEAFKAEIESNPDEALALAEDLARAPQTERDRSVLTYSGLEAPVLVHAEDDRYRIATPFTPFYGQETPKQTLETFVRALQAHRYDVVLRVMPNADKTGLTPDRLREVWSGPGRENLQRLLTNLRQAGDAPIEVVGDRATMPYAGHLRVQFMREDGRWKIEDPE